MNGNLLAAGLDKVVYRVQLNAAGTAVVSKTALFSNVGNGPLDVTATGTAGPFPGTIWVADYLGNSIIAFEPNEAAAPAPGPTTRRSTTTATATTTTTRSSTGPTPSPGPTSRPTGTGISRPTGWTATTTTTR